MITASLFPPESSSVLYSLLLLFRQLLLQVFLVGSYQSLELNDTFASHIIQSLKLLMVLLNVLVVFLTLNKFVQLFDALIICSNQQIEGFLFLEIELMVHGEIVVKALDFICLRSNLSRKFFYSLVTPCYNLIQFCDFGLILLYRARIWLAIQDG